MSEPHSATIDDFEAFVSSMALIDEAQPIYQEREGGDWVPMAGQTFRHIERRLGEWHFSPEPGFDDFNKELCPPGRNPKYPEGVCAIRSDDDFWVVAKLPWRFHALSIAQLVSVLWPDIGHPVFHADVQAQVPFSTAMDIAES